MLTGCFLAVTGSDCRLRGIEVNEVFVDEARLFRIEAAPRCITVAHFDLRCPENAKRAAGFLSALHLPMMPK
ncbi:hypothetical protein ACFQFQ_14675 [Sulfitobacter porphyrae]|uniref:Uncharacterized protein n=1 Tax=Sulfitobacter porphyrae TaxID=1246864 RepID=A0ABW2B4G2_9RHOB